MFYTSVSHFFSDEGNQGILYFINLSDQTQTIRYFFIIVLGVLNVSESRSKVGIIRFFQLQNFTTKSFFEAYFLQFKA